MDSYQKRSQAMSRYWLNSPERKLQLSELMKGANNPAKSILARKKITDSKIGKTIKHKKPISDKQRIHLLSLADNRKGKTLSFEIKQKISLARKGQCQGSKNYFYGKHHTKSSIRRMRITHALNQRTRLKNVYNKAKLLGLDINQKKEHFSLSKNQTLYKLFDPLGYLIGTVPTDAYFGKPKSSKTYMYSIAAMDYGFIDKVSYCFAKLYKFRPNILKTRNLFRIQVSRKYIMHFLKYLRIEVNDQWVFSDNIYNRDLGFIKSILMAVADAEGCATNSSHNGNIISRKISITNTSLVLLKQVMSLLKLFKIKSHIYHLRSPRIAKIRNKSYQFKKDTFNLIITGQSNLRRFKDSIGFVIKRKQKKLIENINSYKKLDGYYSREDYDSALRLSKHFPNCSDISRLTNIPSYTVRNWILHKVKPRAVKVEELI